MRSEFRTLIFAALFVFFLLTSFAEKQPATPPSLPPAEAASQGRALAEEILAQRPLKNFTNTGVLRIRRSGSRTEIPIVIRALITPTNWLTIYQVTRNDSEHSTKTDIFRIRHSLDPASPEHADFGRTNSATTSSTNAFADSDFWLCDLSLEFFHWPDQKILKTELRKTRECKVLESTNPNPAPSAYSRVVSWIDVETDGILHADAYDAENKLLKEFDTKKFKKVKGEWQLEEMEIENVQTDSRSQIEFDLGDSR